MASPSKDPKLDIAKDVPEIEPASSHARVRGVVAEVNPIKDSCKNADMKYIL